MTETTQFLFVCEVCGREETFTNEAAYQAGWDYPPFLGNFQVVSPRTCPDCPMTATAYWALVQGTAFDDLPERHQATIRRIVAEERTGRG